jgi:hypothetical protein
MAKPEPPIAVPDPPTGFRIARDLTSGRHPILAVFPGLDRLPTAAHLQPDPAMRSHLFQTAQIELVDADMWMYVAPWEMPAGARGRWNPLVVPGVDCIVVGRSHLRESAAFTLFMDIFHELRHLQQRHGGAKLFEGNKSYVRRPTEIEAYRFVVEEARTLGVTDGFLRDYLRVEWIDNEEFLELLSAVGVPHP